MAAELFKSGDKECFYSDDRKEWRHWLEDNYKTSKDIWFVFPNKGSG